MENSLIISHFLVTLLIHLISYWITALIYFIIDFQTGRFDTIRETYIRITKKTAYNQLLYGSLVFALFMLDNNPNKYWTILGVLFETSYFFIFFELYFYHMHRLAHWTPIYKYIHAEHHKLHDPFGASAYDAHPMEIIFVNNMPFVIAFLIFNMHIYSIYLAVLISTVNVVKSHSGYNWLVFNSNFHALHHRFSKYNFGFTKILDKIYGTYCDPSTVHT